jgi:hypothetical protein
MYVQHMAFKEIRVSKKRTRVMFFKIKNYRSLVLRKQKQPNFKLKYITNFLKRVFSIE